MAGLRVEGLRKSYGGTVAVDGLSHDFAEGRITALLGPTGSGKSTALWMIAGLIDPDEGAVLIDGRNVTDIPAEKRDVGLVFQDYALFPHLTVRENVAFGLRARGLGRPERLRRADEMLEKVRMSPLSGRRPGSLSGGEQQRVALARALAIRPRVLLLDEPLSALDARLREELRLELFRFLRSLAITTVYVTHDQAEALGLGHELVVLREGRIEQAGKPADVYHRPANLWVARFLGSANIVGGEVGLCERGAQVRLPFASFCIDGQLPPGPVWAMVRPEDLAVASDGDPDFVAAVEAAYFLGEKRRAHVRAAGCELVVDLPNDIPAEVGRSMPFRIRREKVAFWPRREEEIA